MRPVRASWPAPSARPADSAGGDATPADSATPDSTAAAGPAIAATRIARGRRRCIFERRRGSSIQRCVTSAGTSEAIVTAAPSAAESGPSTAAANTSAGQCQTYHA